MTRSLTIFRWKTRRENPPRWSRTIKPRLTKPLHRLALQGSLTRKTTRHALWRRWKMNLDRQTLLRSRDKAAQMVKDDRLSDETRALAKSARDKADVALGLRDALERKAAR